MGKKSKNKPKKELPFVSICTPTFNRRPFIPIMFECFRNQTYPKNRMEWIIVDDGTDNIKDLIDEANIPQIKYFALDEKVTLGKKRNIMHEKTKGDILVYMDDDDYYPPERVSHAVDILSKSKALCAGASELYVYFKHIKQMWQCGPYGPNHGTAGTFAFKRELLKQTTYNEDACLAEEREFLKGYTIPFVQLEPSKTILVFSHEHNTFDKRKMLDNPHPTFMKQSDKPIEYFIRKQSENHIKRFFMEEIDEKLKLYAPGEPINKPDVLKQTNEIEEKRKKLVNEQNNNNVNPPIVMQQPGKEPVVLTTVDAVKIINAQREHMAKMVDEMTIATNKNKELIKIVTMMQKQKINDVTLERDSIKDIRVMLKENPELKAELKAELNAEITELKEGNGEPTKENVS